MGMGKKERWDGINIGRSGVHFWTTFTLGPKFFRSLSFLYSSLAFVTLFKHSYNVATAFFARLARVGFEVTH